MSAEWPARRTATGALFCGRQVDGRFVCQGEVGTTQSGVVFGPLGHVQRDDGLMVEGSEARRKRLQGRASATYRRMPDADGETFGEILDGLTRPVAKLPFRAVCPHCSVLVIVDERVVSL